MGRHCQTTIAQAQFRAICCMLVERVSTNHRSCVHGAIFEDIEHDSSMPKCATRDGTRHDAV